MSVMKSFRRLVFLTIVLPPLTASGGDVESFNTRLFDLQYFTRPFERAAVAGGTWEGTEGAASSILQNPGALGHVDKPELLAYWSFNYLKGETYGLKRLIPPGPGHPQVERIGEEPIARLSDAGAYQAFRLGSIPGMFGLGADYLWNDLSDNKVSRIKQSGYRVGLTWGVPINSNMSVGYGLTHLDDTWHWDVTWAQFIPGMSIPNNVDYLLKSCGSSWRHRFGLQGMIGTRLRYGLEGEFGHGSTDNTWNGVDTGGQDGMEHYGARMGLEYMLTPKMTLAVDGEWHDTMIEFGGHSPSIGRNQTVAKWDTSALRPMIGLKYGITETWKLLGGYRYSVFNTLDMCYKNADTDFNTFSLGTVFSLFEKRLRIHWNIEYSTLDPNGEFMNLLALEAVF